MADKTGVARLRQAVENQATAGKRYFFLSVGEARKLCDECEEELARLSWAQGVPAPVDADGEVVPLDTRAMYDDDGGEMTIKSFTFYVDGGFWRTDPECPSVYAIDRVDLLHLHRPDSWEKLEKDVSKAAGEDICGYFGFALSRPCSAECPARDVRDSCAVTAVRDVMRRAKALAERGAKGASRG